MERIVKITVPRPFVLYVEFDDGVRGEYDMTERLDGPVFVPLRDPRSSLRCAWPNGAHPSGPMGSTSRQMLCMSGSVRLSALRLDHLDAWIG